MRYPIAAPGSIACAIASPVKLMRLNIKKTPMGVAPTDTAMQPINARLMKPKFENGSIKISQIMQQFSHKYEGYCDRLRTSDAL